jgi:SAM-dependent methyltransferase
MKDHFKWFADYSKEYYELLSGEYLETVLDIGCNDGSQLNYFISDMIETYGVDPAENLAKISTANGHEIYVGYFDGDFARRAGNYNILIAQNVFAHNYDPYAFLRHAKNIMGSNSLLFIQTSQADMILNNEFDTIYHEHISFYNINSMNELCKRAGLYLVDVTKCPLHGNSYIFVVSSSEHNARPAHISNLIEMERKAGLLREETYERYATKCRMIVDDFDFATNGALEDGYILVGYGAAAKGMTLLNYANVCLDYIVDDNPLKQNRYTPGMSIPIVSSDILSEFHENDKIVFIPLAWNFFDEIKAKIKAKRNNDKDMFLEYFPRVRYVE